MRLSFPLKALLIMLVCVVAALAGSVAWFRYAPAAWLWRSEIRQGNRAVAEVETFRRKNGRLPADFKEIGVAHVDEDRIYYQKCSENDYQVWFGTELGESMSWSSRARKWEESNTPCN
jgi:hypothetical protein